MPDSFSLILKKTPMQVLSCELCTLHLWNIFNFFSLNCHKIFYQQNEYRTPEFVIIRTQKFSFVIIHLSPLIFPVEVLDEFISIYRRSAYMQKLYNKFCVFEITFKYQKKLICFCYLQLLIAWFIWFYRDGFTLKKNSKVVKFLL